MKFILSRLRRRLAVAAKTSNNPRSHDPPSAQSPPEAQVDTPNNDPIALSIEPTSPLSHVTIQPPSPLPLPPTTFHSFPLLPIELRLQIWQLVAQLNPRLLELRWSKKPTHQGFEIAPPSRRAPALMHVCRESRSEGSRMYELRDFSCSVTVKKKKDCGIWYHPSLDILFFGGFACMATIETFFAQRPVGISKVAFLIKGTTKGCCGRAADLMPQWREWDEYMNVMQILHGASEEINIQRRKNLLDDFPGARGVEDVYFVVKTGLMPLAWHEYHGSRYEINNSVTLRPARHGGITDDQIRVYQRLMNAIMRVNRGDGVPGTNCKRWVDERERPNFDFVSVAPAFKPGRRHDAVGILVETAMEVDRDREKLEKQTEVKIVVGGSGYSKRFVEVGLYGTKDGIKEAAQAVLGYDTKTRRLLLQNE